MNLPFVSCLCLTTAGRSEWLKKAIDCFLSQDYQGGMELVIVADSASGTATHYEPCHQNREGSRIHVVENCGPIGKKRNVGCAVSWGQIVCVFDDDDWSSPGRVTDQVSRLMKSGKSVTGYNGMLFREFRTVRILEESGPRSTSGWWKLTADRALGTSLCFFRDWWVRHHFPVFQCGEDDAFWDEAVRHDEAISVDGQNLMYATNHVGNASRRVIGGSGWEELTGAPVLG